MALTDIKVRNTSKKDKDYKLFDGDGLFVLVTAKGGKYWRFKYRFGGKEKLLALGTYPEVSLSGARQGRDEARKNVAAGVDPSEVRKAIKAAGAECNANSFEVIAREWHNKFKHTWSGGHATRVLDRLEGDVFPWHGSKPVSEIKPVDILSLLRRVESRGALETAHRVRTICGQVLRYAVATGRAERDAAADLRGALPPVRVKHHAALTDPKQVAELLRAIEGFQGSFIVRCALKLSPMLLVRPGELRKAEWSEIDFDAAQWNIPAEKMKMKMAHIVPLSLQAMEILTDLKPLTGNGLYVCPCTRTHERPMSENTVNAALRRMG